MVLLCRYFTEQLLDWSEGFPPLQSIKIEKQIPVNAGEAVTDPEVLREGVARGNSCSKQDGGRAI